MSNLRATFVEAITAIQYKSYLSRMLYPRTSPFSELIETSIRVAGVPAVVTVALLSGITDKMCL